MKKKLLVLFVLALAFAAIGILTGTQETFYHPEFSDNNSTSFSGINTAHAYPPGVGILTNSRNCLTCHVNNGPWKDDSNTIIDILDMETNKSLKQPDGTFLIEATRGKSKTVLTIIGSKKIDNLPAPYRNAWLYIDTSTIGKSTLSKFAPGWDVNLPMSCRIVGDNRKGYEDANITSLPMTIQPTESARDAELSLQVMLTKGEAAKYNAHEGITGSYFERKVKLQVK